MLKRLGKEGLFGGDLTMVVVPTIRATPFSDIRDTIASAINNPRVLAMRTTVDRNGATNDSRISTMFRL